MTIEGTVCNASEEMPKTKNARPLWERLVSVASETYHVTSAWTTKTALPAVKHGMSKAVDWVDSTCEGAAKKEVQFLTRHKGIAMLLSQETVIRMAVAEHYREMSGVPDLHIHHHDNDADLSAQVSVNIAN